VDRQPVRRPLAAPRLPAIKPDHDAGQHQRQQQHRDRPMGNPAPDRQMLDPAEQGRHRVDIGNIRGNDQGRHAETGFCLQAHLAENGTGQAVGQIVQIFISHEDTKAQRKKGLYCIVVIGYPLYAVFESGCAKIHQETERQFRETQICDHLFGVNSRETFGGFEFNQNPLFNDNVRPKGLVQNAALEGNRNDLLSFDKKTFSLQAFAKQNLIRGFAKSRT